MKNLIFRITFLTVTLSASPLLAEEQPPIIAVAANFMGAMEKITAAYEAKTGVKVQTVFSSTGKFYAQITKGAPYDLFLAADAERPELLAEQGFCEKPFVYAVGEAVLWTKIKDLAEKRWQDVVARVDIKKIAISTPQTAPYGAAAMKAIDKNGLRGSIEHKFVYGHNVAQPFQFAFHGSADLAFTALSFGLSEKGKQGTYWMMPEAEKIVQKGCVVKKSKNKATTDAFLDFFQKPSTKSIVNEYDYK